MLRSLLIGDYDHYAWPTEAARGDPARGAAAAPGGGVSEPLTVRDWYELQTLLRALWFAAVLLPLGRVQP